MRPAISILCVLICVLVFNSVVQAEPHKLFVSDFSVTGTVVNKEELAASLKGLLASRLNSGTVQLVKTESGADLVVAGSYALFGKVFSLDAQINAVTNEKLQRVYEQGEGQDDLIPAVGRLAQKINRELEKIPTTKILPLAEPTIVPAAKQLSNPPERSEISTDGKIRNLPLVWISPPIEGVLTGIAVGRTLQNGEREIFVVGEQLIRYYRQGKELKLISEVTFPGAAKIISIDTADLDSDGTPEIYVTIVDRATLASQVFIPKENSLEKIAQNLPYFFRGIGTDFEKRIIHAQKMGARGNFYGDICVLVKTGNSFALQQPLKSSSYASIFNSNRFRDASGKTFNIVINVDSKIVVSSLEGAVVWISSDNYGGSEQYFKQESSDSKRFVEDQSSRSYIEQRMLVTAEGDILVPQNKGVFNIGDYRSYGKHVFYALRWNGSLLEEVWHTSDYPAYLSDFAYDSLSKELVSLEVAQKAGMWGKGRSVISIHKIK